MVLGAGTAAGSRETKVPTPRDFITLICTNNRTNKQKTKMNKQALVPYIVCFRKQESIILFRKMSILNIENEMNLGLNR